MLPQKKRLLGQVRDRMRLKNCAIDDLRISVDGPEEIHDQVRGAKGTFVLPMRRQIYGIGIGGSRVLVPIAAQPEL